MRHAVATQRAVAPVSRWKDPSTLEHPPPLSPLISEQALIDSYPGFPVARGLVISSGRGQAAWKLARDFPEASVALWYADLHDARLAEEAARTEGAAVDVLSAADLPAATYDVIAMPILMRGEAELTRDLLQQAHQRLADGGWLVATVDNPRDQWLHEQLRTMFDKVTCHDTQRARVYWARKTKPLKRVRNFTCEFAFRDEEQLIRAVSRPGVFSHRRLDPGARQLLLTVAIEAGQTVLDLGCGSGVLSLASARRAADVHVYSVDSHARAIECTQRGAGLNQLASITTIWNADGQFEIPGTVDIVLANPPYFGDFAIAEHFLQVAYRQLRSGGAMLLVNKHPTWYERRLPGWFTDVEIFPSGKYHVACGRKP